ncbi:thioesterase II family protein [Streptomyces sp. 6N223]|uniref:thioesterase II family protein n=1 Tax=Streptomyces sp. 6N223 TaxID=3457412 RepID=UPI003FCFECA2
MAGFTNSGGEWVRRFHPSNDSGARLACFPHAGGSASYYFPLSQSLAPGIETLALQYPGRQDRRAEGCVESLAALADGAYAALRDTPRDRPLVFFGHSMGSILAFEVARRFQDQGGRGPDWMIASGYPAPSRLRGGGVHLRDDAGVLDELRQAGGTDPAWLEDEDLVATILPATRGDYTAIETHPRSAARLTCPITMLVGDTDHHTTTAEADAWRDHTTASFELNVFSGGHFYLDQHGPELVETICATVKEILQ